MAANPERYGGLFALSGGLIGEEVREFSGDLEDTPVFFGCAEKDPHIPLERVEESVEVFQDLNADVEKYVFEGSQHGIVEHEIERISEILRR
jgi:phospholipase/carboxylesterase